MAAAILTKAMPTAPSAAKLVANFPGRKTVQSIKNHCGMWIDREPVRLAPDFTGCEERWGADMPGDECSLFAWGQTFTFIIFSFTLPPPLFLFPPSLTCAP